MLYIKAKNIENRRRELLSMADKQEIEKKRAEIKRIFKEFNDRRMLLGIEKSTEPSTIICEGVEVSIKDDKILPISILPEGFKNNNEFIVPDWLECLSDISNFYSYFRKSYSFIAFNQKSIYDSLSKFEKISFINDDIELYPFELERCNRLKYADVSVFGRIPAGLFADCKLLEEVDARNLEVIDKSTFLNCKSLKKIIISSKLRRVKQKAFCNVSENLEIEVIDNLNNNLRIRKDENDLFRLAIERYKKAIK